MTVRCKFRVTSKTQYDSGTHNVTLLPAYANSPENKAFFEATPSGSIELNTVRQGVIEAFEIGQEYYVDFTKAGE